MHRSLHLENPKWWSLDKAVSHCRQLKAEGKTLVLTNGCFDLLHTGHLFFLQEAARCGDVLWVALNGDKSVRLLKGPARPLQSEVERAYSLAALSFVYGIITFQRERLVVEIRALQPDLYVKAGDYSIDTMDKEERAALEEVGTEIIFLPYLEGYSTTELIQKIKRAAAVL